MSVTDVLGTLLLSVLAGHNRYAHMTALRFDNVTPPLLGMSKVVSKDSARRALDRGEFATHRMELQTALIVLRRLRERKEQPDKTALPLLQLMGGCTFEKGDYEYIVLVTNLPYGVEATAQLYRDRADSENPFDELKNQWGWGGFTTQDLGRCQIMARFIALVYNWWSLFVRLINPDKHSEAITSRPMILGGVARQTQHAGQKRLTVSLIHGKAVEIKEMIQVASQFLKGVIAAAEQLAQPARWRLILSRIFVKFLDGRTLSDPVPTLASG